MWVISFVNIGGFGWDKGFKSFNAAKKHYDKCCNMSDTEKFKYGMWYEMSLGKVKPGYVILKKTR